MKPAPLVIQRFGGVRPLARVLGIDHSSVSRWQKPKTQRGTGGLVPSRYHMTLLQVAETSGVQLNALELVKGGRV